MDIQFAMLHITFRQAPVGSSLFQTLSQFIWSYCICTSSNSALTFIIYYYTDIPVVCILSVLSLVQEVQQLIVSLFAYKYTGRRSSLNRYIFFSRILVQERYLFILFSFFFCCVISPRVISIKAQLSVSNPIFPQTLLCVKAWRGPLQYS